MNHHRIAIAIVVFASSLACAGCAEPPPADTSEPPTTAHGHTHGPEQPAQEVDAYDGIVAGITARGDAGARAAWADRRPTLLLFAASW